MEIVYNVGSHDVYSSHLQIKTAQTTILGGLRCFGIQNDSATKISSEGVNLDKQAFNAS